MGTKFPEIFEALAAPIPEDLIRTRRGGNGQELRYVTAKTVAEILDSVLGPEGWDFEIAPWGQDALIGTLIVRLPDGSVVRKSNVGGRASMQQADDDAKSAASDCLKRCATLIGVARDLSGDSEPAHGPRYGQDRPGASSRSSQSTPTPNAQASRERSQGGQDGPRREYGAPKTGKALFAHLVEHGKANKIDLVKSIQEWGLRAGFPARLVDWDSAQVAEGHAEAQRMLGEHEDAEEESFETAVPF